MHDQLLSQAAKTASVIWLLYMYIYFIVEMNQTLIYCTHTSLADIVQLYDINQLETLARDLIFSSHVRRGQILATHYPVKQRRQRATQF